METIKISELEEKFDAEGGEMIPIQIGGLNYKISVDTIVNRSKEILHAYKQYTYSELKQLKDSGLLIPGEHYLLTDYQCIYIQPVSNELITCDNDGWLLMLLATSENTISEDVHVFFTEDSKYIARGGNNIISCKYVFDDFQRYEWADASSKGVIIDLTDSNNNRCCYDFKHIKFRRWALKDVTENDTIGASNQPSCYRCYGTAEEPKRSDSRSWVGSGLEIERQYIKSIFDGTFNSVMWDQSPLHSDYIVKVHKPFKQVENNLQYVAYDTTLQSLSDLNAAVPGLVKFYIDETDYIDCYTFEHNGNDISNIVYNNHINKCGIEMLPNIVILISSDITPIKNSIFDNNIHGYNTTIALHGIEESSIPQMYRCIANELRNSIFNLFRLGNTNFPKVCTNNYVSGSLVDCSFEGLQRSVLFGYFNAVNTLSCTYNLLFGNEVKVIDSNGNWVSTADGNYWYDDVIQDWFGYNIMAPFQYAVFYPHTNTNTVKLPYNKGVTLMGTIQDNFIDRMRWGTIIQYGALQGNYVGELTRCVVSPAAFMSQVTHSSGTSAIYKLEGATKLVNITNTDIKCYQANTKSLVNNLSDEQKTKLNEGNNRKVLTFVNSKPNVNYYNELGTGGSADLSDYYNKDEVNNLLSNVVVEEKEVIISTTEPVDADIWVDLSSDGDVVSVVDAPTDDKQYCRKNGEWSEIIILEPDLTPYATTADLNNHITEAKTYADTVIADLVDSAPETLNTLNELATAIQEHHEVTDLLDAAITNKQDKGNYVAHNGGVSAIVTITLTEYDALEEIDPTTLYIILD